jgi:hypothetical protein
VFASRCIAMGARLDSDNLAFRCHATVFKCLPFLPVLIISIVSVMVQDVCPVLSMWFEYPELLLLLLMA